MPDYHDEATLFPLFGFSVLILVLIPSTLAYAFGGKEAAGDAATNKALFAKRVRARHSGRRGRPAGGVGCGGSAEVRCVGVSRGHSVLADRLRRGMGAASLLRVAGDGGWASRG